MNTRIDNSSGGTSPPLLPGAPDGDDPSSDGPGAGKTKGFLHRYGPRIAGAAACSAVVSAIMHLPSMRLIILRDSLIVLLIFGRPEPCFGPGSAINKPIPKAGIPPERIIARTEALRDARAKFEAGRRSARELGYKDQIDANLQRTEK